VINPKISNLPLETILGQEHLLPNQREYFTEIQLNVNLMIMKVTIKMQLYRLIYYS